MHDFIKKINSSGSYIIVSREDNYQLISDLLVKDRNILQQDVIILPGVGSIKIQEIKDIKKKLILKPESQFCLVEIFNAQNLTLEAGNALLKILEEPPKWAIILLYCDNDFKLLTTVRSRCKKFVYSNKLEKELDISYINTLSTILSSSDDIIDAFAIISQITKEEIDVKKMLIDWIYFLRKEDLLKNNSKIKLINNYLEKYKKGINQKLFLENLILDLTQI